MKIANSVIMMKALADQSRLVLVRALQEPRYVEELAELCNLAASTVSFHLGKLERAGLVVKRREQYYTVYSLNAEVFEKSLRQLTSFHDPDQTIHDERVQRYRGKVLKSFMKGGKVLRIPAQYKKRLIIAEEILRRFDKATTYNEREIDTIISEVCDDYCTIRRTFIDEGMMERRGDSYRVLKDMKTSTPSTWGTRVTKRSNMKTKQDIKREYKERKKPAGVFQVKNMVNGKILLASSLNLDGPLNSHKFMLKIGRHRNEDLQKDWNEFGADKFTFEILELIKEKDDPHFDVSVELTLLEQLWLEKLQPFGERGYNKDAHIRQA